jgi:hypothetical protein
MKKMNYSVWILTAALAMSSVVSAKELPGMLDVIVFGNAESEKQHNLKPGRSEIIAGGLGESARKLLPPETENWEGGRVAFILKVDSEKQNYVTVRLWGSDMSPNFLLFCDGKQIGWRHLGEVEPLDIGDTEPGCNNRFFYRTSPLPLELTKGKKELHCEIRSTGPIWGYGQTFDRYQKQMTEPARGIYRIYTHTDGFFMPPDEEKQGLAPANPPLRKEPGIEMLEQLKQRVNRELDGILKDEKPIHQMKMQFLAKAYYVKWTTAYQNPQVIKQIIKGGDELFAAYRKDPKVAQNGPATYNPDWFGLGPVGDCAWMLAEQLKLYLDETISDGAGNMITRRAAWSEMLIASRDWHRRHRRLYTNQSMINDMYIYSAHRGVAAIDPANAVPDEQIRRYLYESLGLEPWRGSDKGGQGPVETGGRDWGVGDNYWQLTKKGLTKELGYVGYYGEVLDWVAQIYDVTRLLPGQLGDEKIRATLEKMAQARAVFRYPALDTEGFRAMRIETIIGWRDTHYPGDVCYGERVSWDGSALYAAVTTLDPKSIGYAQQMFNDNQFFKSLQERMKESGLRVTVGLLGVPDQYETLKAQPASTHRLPMTHGQSDFVFTDEENGVVAFKRGQDIFYASLYWRARNAINFLARIHYITPQYDRIAVVRQETEFEPGGMVYKRPDWTNFGFGNGGLRYPGDLHSAHAGEELPIAKIPDGIKFRPGDENVYAGKGSFYTLRYGDYLIGMNCTASKTYELKIPDDYKQASDLVSGEKIQTDKAISVAPLSTVVLYKGKSI